MLQSILYNVVKVDQKIEERCEQNVKQDVTDVTGKKVSQTSEFLEKELKVKANIASCRN